MSDKSLNIAVTATPVYSNPLFSKVALLLLLVVLLGGFFVAQLLGVYWGAGLVFDDASQMNVASRLLLGGSNGTVVSVSVLVTAVSLTLLIYALIRWRGGAFADYLGLNRGFGWQAGIAMLGLWLLFVIISESLTYILGKQPLLFMDELYASAQPLWLLIFAMVVIAPIYEELMFRGVLWSAIREHFDGRSGIQSGSAATAGEVTRGAVIASITTSVIFAVIHLQYGWYEIGTLVLLALLFCYARIKTGSLWLPILLHIVNNGVAMWQYMTVFG